MRPTLEAAGLKETLLQYLSTTYALSDEGAREALHRFLGDETNGMFRGPFLRIRTPFTPAGDDWKDLLGWTRDDGWTPHTHQAAAFARLSSASGHTPQPTIITTGTGSGKTEAFLYPILDHCAREKRAGRNGIKAVLLYPMNALATDQAGRINDLLRTGDALRELRAGLYIGERAAVPYDRVFTKPVDMWLSPPDILLTNYKMLDLLLQRERDVRLWADAELRYVVVDEFHTYDGAQGTDVAMLLRRLAAVVGAAEPGRPLGRICPVATSATLVSGTADADLDGICAVATNLFGTEFTRNAVVGESRKTVDEFLPMSEFDPTLPLPTPEQLVALPDPTSGPEALAQLVKAATGETDLDPFQLGAHLRRHLFTSAVLKSIGGGVTTYADLLNIFWRVGAPSWVEAITHQPELAARALTRFVALLSMARDPASTPERPRPFVQVEVHQWARAVSRLVRGVLPWPRAEFRWDTVGTDPHPRTAPLTVATTGQAANLFLPAIYCRACGRSGWAVFSPESDDRQVEFDSHRVYRASTSQDKVRIRNLIAATDEEAREGSGTGVLPISGRRGHDAGGSLMVLDGSAGWLRPPDPGRDYDQDRAPRLGTADSAFVLVHLGDTANTAAERDWCPACGEHNAIRFLGTGSAALAAAAITQLFTGGELDKAQHENKLLMFNDSVQDAAHRAGFVTSRSYTFSLRALLKKHLSAGRPTALHDLIADVVAATTDPETLRAVVPTDLYDLRGVNRLLSGQGRGGDRRTWELIGQRLAFDTIMEFGFRARNGRTLELTRTAAAHVRIPDPAAAIGLVRTALAELVTDPLELAGLDDARHLAFLRIFLERLRTRGAIAHRWLTGYLRDAGTNRYHVWGSRPQGMRAFPRGVAAPLFLLARPKDRSEFDVATGRLSWHEQWARRCFTLPREPTSEFWSRLLPSLVDAGLLSVGMPTDTSARIYGLQPGDIAVQLLTDEEVNTAFVRCQVCSWEQTVHPALLDQWHGQPCPAYRCRTGELVAGDHPEKIGIHRRNRDYRNDYYRRLYNRAGTYQVVTAEHTGMLNRAERERVEQAFRTPTGFKDPNVLSCTPTLELGIDIGDLSAVVLAALPRRPASYAQQVGRAGRRTGNAFLLTVPGRSRRDMYFLDQPAEMIAGQTIPPGCHLSAIEILRRQYLAHLLDLAAHGRLVRATGIPLPALPGKAPGLFGPSGYLADLLDVAVTKAETLVTGFLALFPTGVSEEAQAELRDFAARGLRRAITRAENDWYREEEILRRRWKMIQDAQAELHDSDPEQANQKAELDADGRAVRKSLAERGRLVAQNVLCDLGLLPNYALLDAVTTLQATLYWPDGKDPKTGRTRYLAEQRNYERPRRYALAELAPGNTFYVNGYKHEISGIEIGTPDSREWQPWRFCLDCGHVRTENAVDDRSPCPNCGSARIADDGSCLHQVVQPRLVTSRDKRDDARISDDRDDRDQRYYLVIDAVDITPDALELGASWRHRIQTFGVDYCRAAVIRRINLGPARFDRHLDDELAGQHVRISPFHVCTDCGAATADGVPVFNHHSDAVSSSAARDPRIKHHQPWCRLRRGKREDAVRQQPILLAHELHTEALRVLLPAATMLVEERVHSFRAALRLGVDRQYGGDPQHLDTALASMPDPETRERRHYLVLFDRLPGGTGYLHRLVDAENFKQTLVEAAKVLASCPCKEEGRRACHRCLHRHTEERFQDTVSRQEALDMLADLLGPLDEHGTVLTDEWRTDKVSSTALIGLDRQVESDLEARFLAALRNWATIDDSATLDEDSKSSGYLRFAGTADVVSWRLTGQRSHGYTRTDFTFERVDGPRQAVTVYLDGHRHHARPDRNRIAEDAAIRTRLRAEGHVVFQLTWDDLDLFEQVTTAAEPVWPPYRGNAQQNAREAYENLGGWRADLADTVFVNPMRTMLAFLREPDRALWAKRAIAALTGLMPASRVVLQGVNRAAALAAIRSELAEFHRPATPARATVTRPGTGFITVLRGADAHGVDLIYVMDTTAGTHAADLRWTALAILDDRDEALADPRHRLAWRAWFYWSHLIQFLADAGGEGVQLAVSTIGEFRPDLLTVCTAPERGTPVAPQPTTRELRDPRWDEEILPLLDDDPDLRELAEMLVAKGKQAPVFGYELGEQRWQVDFGWPDPKVGVTAAAEAHDEAIRRDEAYAGAGWQIRPAGAWLADADSLLDLIPDVER